MVVTGNGGAERFPSGESNPASFIISTSHSDCHYGFTLQLYGLNPALFTVSTIRAGNKAVSSNPAAAAAFDADLSSNPKASSEALDLQINLTRSIRQSAWALRGPRFDPETPPDSHVVPHCSRP